VLLPLTYPHGVWYIFRMNKKFIKITVAGFTGLFILSAMLCCCIVNVAEADTPKASCHQSSQETQSTHSDFDLDCDQALEIIVKSQKLSDAYVQLVGVLPEYASKYNIYKLFIVDNSKTSPISFDPGPIYLQHSILRI